MIYTVTQARHVRMRTHYRMLAELYAGFINCFRTVLQEPAYVIVSGGNK